MAYYDFNLGKWVSTPPPGGQSLGLAKPAPLPTLAMAKPNTTTTLAIPKTTSFTGPVKPSVDLPPTPTLKLGTVQNPKLSLGTNTGMQGNTYNPQTPSTAATQQIQPAGKKLDLNALTQLSSVVGVDGQTPPVYTPPKTFTQRFLQELQNQSDLKTKANLETTKLIGGIGQGILQNAYSVTGSLLSPITGPNIPQPSDPVSKFLLGDKPIASLNQRLDQAQNKVLEADKKYGFLNQNASDAEKARSALLLSGLGVGFMATADFTPFGGEKNFLKIIAKSKDAAFLERGFRAIGVADDLARDAAQYAAKSISTEKEAAEFVAHLNKVQKTTKLASGYPPKIQALDEHWQQINIAKGKTTNKTLIKQYEKAQQAVVKQIREEYQAGFINPGAMAQDTKKFANSYLSPIRNTDEATQGIFQTWNRAVNTGGELANKEFGQLANKVDDGLESILAYEKGQPIKGADEVSKTFRTLREEGIKRGLEIPERANYIPQVYKNTPEEVMQAVGRYLADQGVDAKAIDEYLAGTSELPTATAKRLKLEPNFAKQRTLPDYETALKYGLTPKYTNIAQLAGNYRQQMEAAVANRKFIEELTNAGKIKGKNAAPIDWVEVPSLGRGSYASPELAKTINEASKTSPIFGFTAGLSRKLQELRLSAGVPKTSVNFFSIGQLIKELSSGNVRSIGAFLRANSNNASIKWFAKNQEWLEKMSQHGLDISDRVGNFQNAYKNVVANRTWREALGNTWYKGFEEKTFASFMPQLHTQTFKSAFQRGIKKGMSEQEAGEMAADVVRNMFGLFENAGRSKATDDVLSTFFFAPKFRSSMITMLYNTGMAGADFVSSAGGLRKPLNPALYKNRRFLTGLAISYAGYNALNYKLNGHAMWDNESGREFALKIPTKDGGAMYIEFMPSVLSFARSLATGTIALAKGDVDTAKQKYGGIFSMPINIAMQVWSNKDYFGNSIYQEDDTGAEKARKIATHVGLQVNHPYVQAIVDQIDPVYKTLIGQERKGRKKTIIQSIFEASELPLKFSSKEQLDDKARFKIMDENEKKYNEAKRRIQPVYDKIQELYDSGQEDEALRMVEEMSDPDYEIYKNILASDKRYETYQGKKDMFPVVQEVAEYLENGDEAAAEDIINSLDDEEYRLYELERDNIYPEGLPEAEGKVLGTKESLPPLKPISLNEDFETTANEPIQPTNSPVNTIAIAKKFSTGSIGGQCTTFLHKIIDFPSIGDGKLEKFRSIDRKGISADEWRNDIRVGDVVVTGENPTYGHTFMVEEILPGGKVRVLESNRRGDEKITRDRIVDINNPAIYGAIRGTPKPQYQGVIAASPQKPFNQEEFINNLRNL